MAENVHADVAAQNGMKRRTLLSSSAKGLTALAVVSVIDACTGGATSSSAAPSVGAPSVAAASAKPVQTINLYGIYALTGAGASNGLISKQGADFAVAEINSAGGFQDGNGNRYNLAISAKDYGTSNVADAIAFVRQAAADPTVLTCLGPQGSPGFVPAVPVAEQLKIPLLGISALAAINPASTWVYRLNAVSGVADPLMLKVLVPKLGIKRMAILTDQTNAGLVADQLAVKGSASSLGYQVVADEAFRTGDQDFSVVLAKIKATNPDAFWLAAATGDCGKLAKQWSDLGGKAPLMTSNGTFDIPDVWNASGGALKGAYNYEPVVPSAELDKFSAAYQKVYGQPASINAISTYDAIYTVVAAVKMANSGTDREAFRKVLSTLDYRTPLGDHVKWMNPPDGENLDAPIAIVQTTGPGTYQVVK